MQITDHAGKRLKERCGLPKKAFERNANQAYINGIRHNECTGRLKRYCDYLYLSHRTANNIRFLGNHVYLFNGSDLITVIPLPNCYRNALDKISKRKRGESTM